MASIKQTGSCTFSQLHAYEGESKAAIKEVLDMVLEQQKENVSGHDNKGATGLFCVVVHTQENKLKKTLESLGFVDAMQTPRRRGYGGGFVHIMLWRICAPGEEGKLRPGFKEWGQK